MSDWFYRTPCLCLFFHYLGAPTAGFRVIDGSRDPVASRRFDDLVNEARLVIEMVTVSQARSPAKPIATLARAAATRRG